jgi:hypothetical protein
MWREPSLTVDTIKDDAEGEVMLRASAESGTNHWPNARRRRNRNSEHPPRSTGVLARFGKVSHTRPIANSHGVRLGDRWLPECSRRRSDDVSPIYD